MFDINHAFPEEFAMIEHDIAVQGPAGPLAGTLMVPDGPGPHPAALILGGSGPLDRDGNVKRVSLNVSRDLARLLGAQGWASLRFDKRGVGSSAGEYLPTGFWDELADASAALDWLAARPEVGPVIAVGHSAGASMAAELAAGEVAGGGVAGGEVAGGEVAGGGTGRVRLVGAVLLAATAKTGEETLVWQAQEVAKTLPGLARFVLRVMRTDVATQQRKVLDRVRGSSQDVIRVQGARLNARWMREFMAYDPMPALRAASVPLLAVTGSKDVQVDPADLATIASAASTAETRLLKDVDHILRHEPAPVSNVQRYKKQAQNPMDPRVEACIVDWLASLPVGAPDA
ncbi:alpha/beta hydrolase [Demequina pelophila]|uniref:alpha/beta hydrolase n=1 Tax=Demequina pelophila TaxID=1638984 RepID=UPI0007863099|nr:alpha/beta fold hydrolase [Demequina pelophila]